MAAKDVEPVGMLVELDRCTGCSSCQIACQQANHYSYDEKWMECVRRNPVLVDGKLRMYHLVAPSLDKCAECVAKEPTPLCMKVCMGNCLYIAPVEKLLPVLAKKEKCLLFTP